MMRIGCGIWVTLAGRQDGRDIWLVRECKGGTKRYGCHWMGRLGRRTERIRRNTRFRVPVSTYPHDNIGKSVEEETDTEEWIEEEYVSGWDSAKCGGIMNEWYLWWDDPLFWKGQFNKSSYQYLRVEGESRKTIGDGCQMHKMYLAS